MARKDPIPSDNASAAEYLDGVAWAGAHQSDEVRQQDEHTTELANGGTGDEPKSGLFHRS